jgi:signal transduction histidine kinase
MHSELATRVLFLAPTRKDGEITRALLEHAELRCLVLSDLPSVVEQARRGAGAILLTENALAQPEFGHLLEFMNEQPAWSDLPVILMVRGGITPPALPQALRALNNVTLLERPASTRSVVSTVQSAVRSRQRQYQIQEHVEALRKAQEENHSLLESERAARQDATRASRMKDDFLATLSHELRTPLNAIYGWAQLIRMNPSDQEMLSQGVDVIERNVRLQTQLIEDLLDVSRIIAGKVRLNLQLVDLAEVLHAAVDSVTPALNEKRIAPQVACDRRAAMILGDAGRIQQVFWNLLVNAIKFTPEGGKIWITVAVTSPRATITITDNGEGIPAEFLPHLFNRFSQADGSITRRHGGLGLGLSIVQNLIQMHGGSVSASSPGIGRGASFVISLPLDTEAASSDQAPQRQPSAAAPLNAARVKGVKVLVVDDEDDSRSLLEHLLTKAGAEPVPAASAAEALQILSRCKLDVIVSDIGMPVQDGYAFMKTLRAQGLHLPAIALTAFARNEDRLKSLQAGYQSHLTKPVDAAELLSLVASLTSAK